MKILTDVHTHTTFSADGIDDIWTMLAQAKALGLTYWGISEHFDYDYKVNGITYEGTPIAYTDSQSYFAAARLLQSQTSLPHILVGCEFGFTDNPNVFPLYDDIIEKYEPDFIVNSVHTQGMSDYYEPRAFGNLDKQTSYGHYLGLIRKSLDAPYRYDIVGHIGYVCRKAPYADRIMHYSEFSEQLDDILTTIIKKDKILEVNSSVKGLDTPFLPFPEIVGRYYQLGGRMISFASDAHNAARLADGRETAMQTLKSIGFTHLTIPCHGKKTYVPI